MTTETIEETTLSVSDRQRFAALETKISDGLKSFVEVGSALREIRDTALYRATHETFEAYCQDRWKISRPRAYQLIDGAEVVEEVSDSTLSTIVDKAEHPEISVDDSTSQVPNEGQARELSRAPKGQRKAAWKKAVASAPKDKKGKPKVTAVQVRKVVEKEPPDEPTDELDKPLPDRPKLREVFAVRHRWKEIMGMLSRAKGEVEGFGDATAYLSKQQFDADLNNARRVLRFAMPYAVCPYCKGTAKRHTDCNACKGLGWVSEGVFNGAPKELQAAGGKK